MDGGTASLEPCKVCKSQVSGEYVFAVRLDLTFCSSISNNPAWALLNPSIGGANLTALVLGVLAVVERIDSHRRQPQAKTTASPTRKERSTLTGVIASSSLGALIFILHALLSDSGTMIAWTWTGYPIQG
jgi:hypothetical protein